MGLLSRLLGKSLSRSLSLENPSISLSDPHAVEELFGNRESAAGIRVTEHKALGYPPLWRGLNLLSDSVAKLALNLYQRTASDGRKLAESHPAYRLMRHKPHPLMMSGIFKKTLTYHALFFGNGYAAIFRDGRGNPQLLQPLSPSTFPLIDYDGSLWYFTTLPNGQQRKIPARDIFHVKGLSFDGLTGYSVIEIMADALGLGIAARDYAALFFAQGANASGVLMIPGHLDKNAQEQAMKDFAKITSGLKSAHKVGVLQDNVKWQPFTVEASKAQLIESRRFEVREVASILGIPPHKLGDDSRSSYSSLEQENQSYLDEALNTWLQRWEEECWDKLLSTAEQETDSHYFEFNRQALLSVDLEGRYRSYAIGRQWGWLSANDIRRKENLEEIEGGDVYLSPANMVDAEGLDETEIDETETDPPTPTPEQQPAPDDPTDQESTNDGTIREAQVELITERLGRLTRMEQQQIVRAAESERNFVSWLERFLPQQESRYADALGSLLPPIFRMSRDAREVPPLASGAASRHITALKERLLAVAGDSTSQNLKENITTELAGWDESYLQSFATTILEHENG